MRASFAKKLCALRQEAGVSQREAAAALGVSQALLSHYEKGIREPGLDFVVRAADYYGVTCDALLEHAPAITPAPTAFAREVERDVRCALEVALDLLYRNYDSDVFGYAAIYMGGVLYEIIRHLSRLSPSYDQADFHLQDESFDSGAVASDLSWVRAQMIMALRQYQMHMEPLPAVTEADLAQRYGQRYAATKNLLSVIGQRVARQNATVSEISYSLYTEERRASASSQSVPKEEDNL